MKIGICVMKRDHFLNMEKIYSFSHWPEPLNIAIEEFIQELICFTIVSYIF